MYMHHIIYKPDHHQINRNLNCFYWEQDAQQHLLVADAASILADAASILADAACILAASATILAAASAKVLAASAKIL